MSKFLNILSYSIPIAALGFIMWGPQLQAKNDNPLKRPPLYASSDLSTDEIQPVPRQVNINPGMLSLGEKLFKDSRLSEQNINCVSCHNLNLAGNDGVKKSLDIRGGYDLMNTPTIFNASLNPLLTWYGKNMTLEQQIDSVLSNKKHMDGNWHNIIIRLKKDANYVNQFDELFFDGITRDNIKHAIASFERSLVTPDAPFDNYLRGDDKAISQDQKKGFTLFKQYGCISCHQGINIGGNLHAKLGIFISPFKTDEIGTEKSEFNLGRYNITQDENDKHVFRVPSLRNVEKTAPYFHSGDIDDLESAIKFMAKYQIGREIDNKDVQLIAEFLRSLTGQYKGNTIVSKFKIKD